ncbi:MAG: pyridoxamine 5'-phosphate oxidase family protein, partial [Caldilinea sp.]
MGTDVTNFRKEYRFDQLSEATAGADPWQLFEQWFRLAGASGIHEPNAMSLATATPDGRPSQRVVLLKGVDRGGFIFFTNYESRKG